MDSLYQGSVLRDETWEAAVLPEKYSEYTGGRRKATITDPSLLRCPEAIQ